MNIKYLSILCIIGSILFIFFPVIFLVFLLPSIFLYNNKKILIYYIIISISIISTINSLRVTSVDLIIYIERYNLYGQQSWLEFLSSFHPDFLFYFTNKIIYDLSFGNQYIMIFFWSFVIYSLLAYSLYLLLINKKITKEAFALGLVLLLFSTTFLSLSSHLVRQMVASSFFTLYIVFFFLGNQKTLLLIPMVTIHFSSIILLVPIFVKNKILYIALFVLAIYIARSDTNIFSFIFREIPVLNISFLDFILNHINGAMNKTKDDGSVPIIIYLVSVFLILFLIFLIKIEKKIEYTKLLYPFLYIFLLYNLFFSIQLLWLRYSFYQYSFYFILLSILFTYIQKQFKLIKFLYFVLSMVVFMKFYLFFDNNYWSSNSHIINLVDQNIFYLLNLI